MSDSDTVVINAAGTGSRLGLNIPKSLVSIAGKSLIERQLTLLSDVEHVTVVVGFKGRELVNVIWQIRRDVVVVINHNYAYTGTAHSLALGAKTAKSRVISLDGDLLIDSRDFNKFLNIRENMLGVTSKKSKLPVLARVENGLVNEMDYDIKSSLEWTGLMNLERDKVMQIGSSHVFEGIKKFLPIKALEINCFEIDEPMDIIDAEIWISSLNKTI
jgi:choline kinase